jgi:hypothetical protein
MSSNINVRSATETSDGGDVIRFRENGRGVAEEARKRLAEVGEIITNVIVTRPVLALGAALAAGVMVGWLIKRR